MIQVIQDNLAIQAVCVIQVIRVIRVILNSMTSSIQRLEGGRR
ncbi:hypothetical protein [Salipiger sp.]